MSPPDDIKHSIRMLRVTLLILFCVQLRPQVVQSARILGVFPIPSHSHQIVFRALMMELAKRGHELVIITPNPTLPKDRPPDNITEIDTSAIYQYIAQIYQDGAQKYHRGVVIDINVMFGDLATKYMTELSSYLFDLPEIQALMNDKSQKFDLVFAEAVSNCHLMLAHTFKAPIILFSAMDGYVEHLEAVGALTYHPLYYPNIFRQKYRNLSLLEMIQELYVEYKLYYADTVKIRRENEILKEKFGPDAPTVQEMRKNVQMMFIKSHAIFGNNRPVPPSVVYLGALHLQPVKPLPQDLKTYLDSSSRGVVYVSLGTNVRPELMTEELLDVFLNAFEALPYDILWKFDNDNNQSVNMPKNVKVQKWFPQRDLLAHPNIKVFVMQGGMQSTDEAVDSAVPLVGIPMMADQWFITNKYIELDIGVELDPYTFIADDLVNAVNKVIKDDRYKKNIERLRDIVRDQPQTSLERGVWWTEHVLRHGGAHLRAPAANTTWSDYLMLDVVVALVTVAIGLVLCTGGTIVYIYKRITKVSKIKTS